MPPKAKLYKVTGKSLIKRPPPVVTSQNGNLEEAGTSNNVSTETAEMQQFEIELCWCIQQLQTALKSGKLNPKQGTKLAFYFIILVFKVILVKILFY